MSALRWLEFETVDLTQVGSQDNEINGVDEIPNPDKDICDFLFENFHKSIS